MSENVKMYSKLCSKIGFALLIFYAAFTLGTFAVAVFSVIAEKIVGAFTSDVMYEIFAAIVYFFSFSGAAFILRRSTKDLPCSRLIYTSFKLNKWIVMSIVAIIAVNFTLAYLNTVMITSLSPSFASSAASSGSEVASRPMAQTALFFILSIISTAIVPAVCEEYLFRGAILTNLMPFGKTVAIIASAFLFGLMHQNPLQILYTTLMGIVIGCVYVKTKSIWVCMIIHFSNNLITVLEEYLPLLTGLKWIDDILNLLIMVSGAIALVVLLFKKDKELSVEETGSFSIVCDSGMDVEEIELDIPRKNKIKHFFTPTIIIYTIICVFLMIKTLLSFF